MKSPNCLISKYLEHTTQRAPPNAPSPFALTLRAAVHQVGAADAVGERAAAVELVGPHRQAARTAAAALAVRADRLVGGSGGRQQQQHGDGAGHGWRGRSGGTDGAVSGARREVSPVQCAVGGDCAVR